MNGTRSIVGACLVLLTIVPLGCAGDDDAAPTQPPTVATRAATLPATATTEPIGVTTAPEQPASTEPATSTSTTTTAAPATTAATTAPATTAPPPSGVVPGLASVELLTSGTGLGARPLLRWEPVDGAAAYVLSVNAPDGGPLWAWEGSATEVPYGGGPADDPDTTGARLLQPATWFVAAKSADGALLAVSAPVDLAP